MIPGQVHTSSTALALFDQLAPVAPAELLGDWHGQGLATGHPLDGVLEAWHWHGKRFLSTEAVHPLIFAAAGGRRISVDPNWVPMALLRAPWVGRLAPLGRLAPWLVPLLATESPGRGCGSSITAIVSAAQWSTTISPSLMSSGAWMPTACWA